MENNQTTALPKKTKKKRIFLLIVFFAALAAGFTFIYKYYEQQSNFDNEMQSYQVLVDNESIADYEEYLERFPDGAHAAEVRDRLEELKKMYAQWRDINVTCSVRDYELFMRNYPQSVLVYQCRLKIDSLDWLEAQKDGSQEAIEKYLSKHPDGRYTSEASIAQEKLQESVASPDERMRIASTIEGFFRAFGNNDETAVFTYITPTMTKFLSKSEATKADVADIIARTYNEHILSCRFIINDDYVIKRSMGADGEAVYTVSFSVDQHITRDNTGKTFGSYTAEANLNSLFKISSLTLKEISKKVTEQDA